MSPRRRILLGAVIATVVARAGAAPTEPAVIETTRRGPWAPATLAPSASAPLRGAALQAQAEAKLRSAFDAAAARHGGTLTRSQARSAGLGWVAQHFDRIDRDGRGSVGFADLQRYVRQRTPSRER